MSDYTQNINPSECEYHVEYYDICLKNCFYCKDNVKGDKCPKMTDTNKEQTTLNEQEAN